MSLCAEEELLEEKLGDNAYSSAKVASNVSLVEWWSVPLA
jgi:hypothetical protein